MRGNDGEQAKRTDRLKSRPGRWRTAHADNAPPNERPDDNETDECAERDGVHTLDSLASDHAARRVSLDVVIAASVIRCWEDEATARSGIPSNARVSDSPSAARVATCAISNRRTDQRAIRAEAPCPIRNSNSRPSDEHQPCRPRMLRQGQGMRTVRPLPPNGRPVNANMTSASTPHGGSHVPASSVPA